MKLNAQNLALAFLAATTLGLGVQLYQTRQQLAEARNAPSLEVKRSDIHVSAAPAAIVGASASAAASLEAADSATDAPEAGSGALPGPGGPAGPGAQGGRGARFAAQMAELMKDPEFAAAMKLEQEARLDQRYAGLFKDLNLPPDKLAAFKTLLAERENAGREVWASAAAQGLNPRENRDQLRQLEAELRAEVEANIQSTLGPAVANALNSFNASAPQRAMVSDLNQRLAYAGQPLNETQSRMLTSILAETARPAGRSVAITDATIARAQGVLMPSQIESLKKLQAEQQARQLIADKTRAAREQAQANRNRD